jgi:nitrilase
MGDVSPVIRGAAVQAAPVFLDREATTDKARELIEEAGANGARVIAFPEGFIPAHPIWFHFHSGTDSTATRLSTELFKNSVEIPGPEVAALGDAARAAGAYVVMGLCEKDPGTFGTMYNTQLFLGPDGNVLGKHQKLVPTVGERLVHRPGGPETFGVFDTDFGPMSGLMCGENSNPLAIFALTAEFTRVHVMAWPNHFPKISVPMADIALTMARGFAQMSKAFVISAAGVVDDRIRDLIADEVEDVEFLSRTDISGGSVIVGPDTRILAGPVPGEREEIIYADMDFDVGIRMKLRHDFAGHYNRADVFRLLVNRSATRLIETYGEVPPRLQSAGDEVLDLPEPLGLGSEEEPPESS